MVFIFFSFFFVNSKMNYRRRFFSVQWSFSNRYNICNSNHANCCGYLAVWHSVFNLNISFN